jgi:hypothetical protein
MNRDLGWIESVTFQGGYTCLFRLHVAAHAEDLGDRRPPMRCVIDSRRRGAAALDDDVAPRMHDQEPGRRTSTLSPNMSFRIHCAPTETVPVSKG